MNNKSPLIVSTVFSISASRLFKLLSTPDYLEQWLSPHESIKVNVIKHDFTIGGYYQLEYTLPDKKHSELRGKFIQIDKPNLISFSWVWQKPDIHSDIESIVTWQLQEVDDETRLTVIHEGPNKEFYDRHQAGWNGTLDRLSKVVAQQ